MANGNASEPARGVIAAGVYLIDVVKTIDRWPDQDAVAIIERIDRCGGGGAYNVAACLKQLDPQRPVTAAGCIGDDANGRWIEADCRRREIATTSLRVEKTAATSFADVMQVRTTGRRTFFQMPAAHHLFTGDDIDFKHAAGSVFFLGTLGVLGKLDHLHDDASTGASRLLADARRHGLTTAVDCTTVNRAAIGEQVRPVLKEADLFFCNEVEAAAILDVSELEPLPDLARRLRRLGGHGEVIVHSATGAAVATRDRIIVQPAVAVPESQIIGANGAGDAFAAGYLDAHLTGGDVAACLRLAVAAAAMCVTDATTTAGVGTVAECHERAARFGYLP